MDSCNLDANVEEMVINFVLCFLTIQAGLVLCFWLTPVKLVPQVVACSISAAVYLGKLMGFNGIFA